MVKTTPRGDRFAGRPDRLHDVVLEDRRAAEPLEHRDREHGDRDRRADRQAGAQAEVDRRGAEDQSEQHAEQHRLGGEFRRRLGRRHERLEGGGDDRIRDFYRVSHKA